SVTMDKASSILNLIKRIERLLISQPAPIYAFPNLIKRIERLRLDVIYFLLKSFESHKEN
ncbi:MAG: hypothetical protein QXO45_04550, partial [Nitrososphaerota archaeon]